MSSSRSSSPRSTAIRCRSSSGRRGRASATRTSPPSPTCSTECGAAEPMATRARGRNEPIPRPIIVKKIVEAPHGAHHGGAWKVAYADFVTAMMAFFLLLWLLGMTDEQKRKGIADYFAPTLVEMKQNSAGSNGLLNGESLISHDNYPNKPTQTGTRSIVIPRDSTGGSRETGEQSQD